ncbi:MAG: hypothetical protein JWQ30_2536 [Sediminibacterium sp.]|nr:hypothetical protein [Sediminibacterium sp.]
MVSLTLKYVHAVFIGTCIIFLMSCNNTDRFKNLHPYENNLGIKPAKLAQIDTIHFTTIQWTEPNRNFGTIKEGDSVFFTYKFKNTGEHPLFISNVKPSCGCTLTKYSEEALMPGKESEIVVKFDSFNEFDDVYKTITVTTNTSNKVHHVLSFHGHVNPSEKPSKNK